jgi:GNAT superfamily N-acetyltransferase
VNPNISFEPATLGDSRAVAVMLGELLGEISDAAGVQAFNFDPDETQRRLTDFLAQALYFVFLARYQGRDPVGFLTLCETRSLYAEGTFGILPELYVRPAYRSQGIGRGLLEQAMRLAKVRGWRRLEVTTPPLPAFDAALRFYEREGFRITGGRKLKLPL